MAHILSQDDEETLADKTLNELAQRIVDMTDNEILLMQNTNQRVLGQFEMMSSIATLSDKDEQLITMAVDMAFYELIVRPRMETKQ